jgi:hypothetical protein
MLRGRRMLWEAVQSARVFRKGNGNAEFGPVHDVREWNCREPADGGNNRETETARAKCKVKSTKCKVRATNAAALCADWGRSGV